MERERAMSNRVRGYVATTIGAVAMTAVGLAGTSLVAPTLGPWGATLASTAFVALAPAIGSWAARRFLKCPACDGPVGDQAVACWTLLAPVVGRSCPHCGVALFDEDLPRRSTAVLSVVALLLTGLGLLGTIVTSY